MTTFATSSADTDLHGREDERQDLLSLLKANDPGAADCLLEQYGERVHGLSRRILACDEDAKDAALETFVTVLDKWPTFKGNAAFSTWIYRVAQNQACMMLRRRRRHDDTIRIDNWSCRQVLADGTQIDPQALVPDEENVADNLVDRQDRRRAIDRAIDALPPIDRDLVRLRDMEGMSVRQVADRLDLSEPAAKSRLHRARLRLRRHLAQLRH